MKKFAKFILAITVIGSLSTSSLFAQDDYYDGDYVPVSTAASNSAMDMGWMGWAVVGLALGGVAAVAALSNNNGSTGH